MNARSVTWRGVLVGSCLLAVGLSGCGGGGGGGTRYYEDFTMTWDADTQTMSAARVAEPRDVQGTYVRLSSPIVYWDEMEHTLSGLVYIQNIHSETLSDILPQIISYDPSDQSITDIGLLYYADLEPGALGGRWWIFTDPNDVDFTFTVRVSFTIG